VRKRIKKEGMQGKGRRIRGRKERGVQQSKRKGVPPPPADEWSRKTSHAKK